MKEFDPASRMRSEILLKKIKTSNTSSTTKPEHIQPQHSSSKTTQNMELTDDLHVIQSYCKDLYQQRDEDAEKIMFKRADNQAEYEFLFSDKELLVAVMIEKEIVNYEFSFKKGNVKKDNSILNNTGSFVKLFHKIVKDTQQSKNKIFNYKKR